MLEFSCPICFELYTEKGKKVPRMLECGHTFCHGSCFASFFVLVISLECLQESLLAFGGRLICGKCGSATDDTTARRGCHALKINQTVLDKIVSKRTSGIYKMLILFTISRKCKSRGSSHKAMRRMCTSSCIHILLRMQRKLLQQVLLHFSHNPLTKQAQKSLVSE